MSSYIITLPDGTPLFSVNEKQVVDAYGLTFTGRRRVDYGNERNQNLLNLLSNFASDEDAGSPGNPQSTIIPSALEGQLWFETSNDVMYINDGSAWVSLQSTFSITADEVSVSPAVAGGGNVQDALEGLNTAIGAISFTAAEVSFDDSGLSVVNASDVQEAIEDLDTAVDTNQTNISNLTTQVNNLSASDIDFSSYLTITSSNVQGAIQELKDELNAVASSSVNASAVGFTPFGSIGSTNVQDAIEELEVEVNGVQSGVSTNASNLTAHLNDTVDAHDAQAISVSPTVEGQNNVQDALEALEAALASSSGVSESGTTAGFTPTCRDLKNLVNPLSGTPDMMQIVLVCQSANAGFSAGDVVVLDAQGNQWDEGAGPAQEYNILYFDTSANRIKLILNYLKTTTDPIVGNPSSTAASNSVQLTPGSWTGFVKAIRF